MNLVLSLRSPTSLPLSPRKRNLLPTMVPCKQMSKYLLHISTQTAEAKFTLPPRAGLLLISCAVTLAVARQDSVVQSDNCINFSHIGLEPTEDCKFQWWIQESTYLVRSFLSKPMVSSSSLSWVAFIVSKSLSLNFFSRKAYEGWNILQIAERWIKCEWLPSLEAVENQEQP